MGHSSDPQAVPGPLGIGAPVPPGALISQVGSLLDQVEQQVEQVVGPPPSEPVAIHPEIDNHLAQVRLGIAGSLFTALKCKHAAAAGHAMRVALAASAWGLKMELPRAQRDVIEVAALLHDVGVIGLPDHILLKPERLDAEELQAVDRCRKMSLEILRGACADAAILEIVANVSAWFDGSREGYRVSGTQIPFGARMISILEAFDSMTTDQVFRRAMSQERAMSEIFKFAGTQFDPDLVRRFAAFQSRDQSQMRCETAGRWLDSLDAETANSHWEMNPLAQWAGRSEPDLLFPARLLDNMHDAVVFIDSGLHISYWNHGAERLTGIMGDSIVQHLWSPSLLSMCNEKGNPVIDDDCPVRCATASGVQSMRRLSICGRTGRTVVVDAHAIPVTSPEGLMLGSILLLHDASSETSLELRCQSLHEKATKDPLTQVANRAEFDRVHEMFVNAHREQKVPCSLIMCDLDHFKQVNDNFGHQAGDDAIKALATLMKNCCRPGDLVARYGGEEFVMLCADCDNAAVARRAEAVRKAMAQLRQPRLGGRVVTASFGVTEVQPGDTPETMLRRADRALLMAKEKGRNMVVQLGIGASEEDPEEEKGGFWWRRTVKPRLVVDQNLVTPVPVQMTIEKLRGFVADHQATIVKIEKNAVELQIDDKSPNRRRRFGDRPVVFTVELSLEEERVAAPRGENAGQGTTRTRIHVTITPQKSRDRRRTDIAERAREVLVSLRSYLMASEEGESRPAGLVSRAQRIIAPWKKS